MPDAGSIDSVFIGRSPAFLRVLDLIDRFSRCDAPVLIQGETGTGKELAARAIHYSGARRNAPFLPVNCGAIPETLVESELFGHVRGAFTDAREARSGMVAQAEGGTLFLDEIEALEARGQVALLRFLQNLEYRPVGSSTSKLANVRVVAACNGDLAELARRGICRRDLFFRLNVFVLDMPPLRVRGDDVTLLAEAFAERFCRRYGMPRIKLDPACLDCLAAYDWPGNVREFENIVHSPDARSSPEPSTPDSVDTEEQRPRRTLVASSLRIPICHRGQCGIDVLRGACGCCACSEEPSASVTSFRSAARAFPVANISPLDAGAEQRRRRSTHAGSVELSKRVRRGNSQWRAYHRGCCRVDHRVCRPRTSRSHGQTGSGAKLCAVRPRIRRTVSRKRAWLRRSTILS
jgi:DNA-binding NtrC family response regulator